MSGLMSRLASLVGSSHDAQVADASDQATSGLATRVVLIDVRSPGEFGSGHIDGALSLPLDRIHADIARLVPDRTTPLVLYCRSGARSGSACAIVGQMGYESVRNGGGIGSLALTLQRSIRTHRA